MADNADNFATPHKIHYLTQQWPDYALNNPNKKDVSY